MSNNQHACDMQSICLMLEDQLPEDRQSELIEHLDSCEHCQQALESQAAEATMWDDTARFLASGSDEDTVINEYFQTNSGHDSQVSDIKIAANLTSLDFLLPSDDDSMLGRVGSYEVSGVIGTGGMGIVLKAFEPALKRYVAIKVLAPHLATSGAARLRFFREAQAAAAVVHDHVVPIYAVDNSQGLPYMVMRYVAGSSLQRRINFDGPLRIPEILRIALQTANGLSAAHAQGLIHRDIKPANILLERNVERAVITDFGLARAADDANLTRSGVIVGTPLYMAPEQARGEAVDVRSDLFSLGSVIYAMATGHSPFRAENTMGILHRLCNHTPRPMRELNPDIPAWLDDIVLKLHAREPADRFQSAEELGTLLEAHLAYLQQPTVMPKPPRLELPHRISQDKPHIKRGWLQLAAACVALTLIGAWVVSSGLLSGTSENNPTVNPIQPVVENPVQSGPLLSVPTAAEIQTGINELNGELNHASLEQSVPVTDVDHAWNQEMQQLNQQLNQLEQEITNDAF